MKDDVLKYREIKEKLEKISYALFVINFDEATVCPKKDKKKSMEVATYFYNKQLEIILSDDYYELLGRLNKDHEGLTEVEIKAIAKEYEDITYTKLVPKEVYFRGNDILDESYLEWQRGQESLDFTKFEDCLAKVINYNKEIISYKAGKYQGYDVLINEFEKGFNAKIYDEFFDLLEREILPLMKKVIALPKKYNEEIKNVKFDIDKQKKLTKLICEAMGYNDDVGYIGETLHPFTNWANHNDVRTTTKYSESLLFSNIYSVMHEVGHATYQLQTDEKYDGTYLFDVESSVLHESQSRFYENYLGRSKAFIKFLYPHLKEIFPEEMAPFTFDDVYYYVNDVAAQLIRCEADELTYPFHILIRYKIEKMIFNGEITAYQVADKFADLMEEYLGIRPTNKKEGAFQDVHWSGSFGYFPTYAVGSAFGAQVLNSLEKDIDINPYLEKGDFTAINKWLKDHIHHLAGSESTEYVIKNATVEDLNFKYYIEYLKKKFKEIYNI